MKRSTAFVVIAALLAVLLSGCASDALEAVSVEAATRYDAQTDETWLYIDCHGLCTVTNAEGQTLVCDVGAPSGDLAFSNHHYSLDGGVDGCSVASFLVGDSDSFTFSTDSDTAGFAVSWTGFRQDISCTGIQQAVFTPDAVTAVGNEMDYAISVSASVDTLRTIHLDGTAASEVSYQGRSEVTVKSDAPCTASVQDSDIVTSPLLAFDIPSGITAVIKDAASERIRYGGLE